MESHAGAGSQAGCGERRDIAVSVLAPAGSSGRAEPAAEVSTGESAATGWFDSESGAAGCQGQAAVFDAFGADERIGNLLHILCFTFDDQNLEAVIVIQMDVNG